MRRSQRLILLDSPHRRDQLEQTLLAIQLGVGRLSPRERVGLFNYALSRALDDLNRSQQR